MRQENLNWDLSDLYKNKAEIELDKEKLKALVNSFIELYKGKLSSLDSSGILKSIQHFEEISTIAGLLSSYSYLGWSVNNNSQELTTDLQGTQEFLTKIMTPLTFFTLELNQIDDSVVNKWLGNPAVLLYKTFFDDIRKSKPHELSIDAEEALSEFSVIARTWSRLFDETMADLRFKIDDGKELTLSDILHNLSEQDRDLRKKSAEQLSAKLKEKEKTLSLITNTLSKNLEIKNRLRKYKKVYSSRNLSNGIDDETMVSLVETVKNNYTKTSHRYYKIKAKLMGVDKLKYYDRNAPYENAPTEKWTFDEARDEVLLAYSGISPELAKIGELFFKNNWIDVMPKSGKSSGAFAHPTVVSKHPYLLLNFYGKTRDVMTLAHELGHGIHQYLARDTGEILSSTPITLAETASVFGEMATFKHLLKTAPKEEKRHLLTSKIEDMINTSIRQVSFHFFEEELHSRRQNGELSANDISDIWIKTQSESLGDSIELTDDYKVLWGYIPHFIHSPFYVYAYAFGDNIVNSLFSEYNNTTDKNKFVNNYINLLKAGGSKPYTELLEPFSLNPNIDNFWQGGINVLIGFIDELEELI